MVLFKVLVLLVVLFLISFSAIQVPPTRGVLPLNFVVTTQGGSSDGFLQWSISNNVGVITVNGETFTAIAYYTQVMGWPNPPGVVRWIDFYGISKNSNNLCIVYLGLDPEYLSEVTSLWEEDYTNSLNSYFYFFFNNGSIY